MGWATIALILAAPLSLLWGVLAPGERRRRLDEPPSGGGLLGMDELFHPAAYNARLIWVAEQIIPVPAPTPDKGPGVIEAGSRITIDVADAAGRRAG